MFKPGQHIPAGIFIEIRSWENDGDHYNSEFLYNVPEKFVNQLLTVLQWFEAKADDLGGEDVSREVLAERLVTGYHEGYFSKEFIETYFKLPELPRVGALNSEFDAFYNDIESLHDDFYKFIGYPVDYDYEYCRNVSDVTIRVIEEDIIIPVLPEPAKKFCGEYQKRIDGKWVSNTDNEEWKYNG